MKLFSLLTALALLTTRLTFAQQAEPQPSAEEQAMMQRMQQMVAREKTLKYQDGTVLLKDDLATIQVTPAFRFLGPQDSQVVLHDFWGNPPDSDVLGMLLPKGVSPLDENSWAVIITYEETGYVKDDEAAKIDYNELLQQMQAGEEEINKERQQQGYAAMHLLGWAATPRYDAAEHKLYWAKRLKASDAQGETLNYNIRVLGRKGVLQLNAVAGMNQLKQVEAATPEILSMVNFNPGNRYADFNASTDKVAEYGLTALIAGGVLAKSGILKGIIAALVAGKKFVIIGAIALFAFLKNVIFGKSKSAATDESLRS